MPPASDLQSVLTMPASRGLGADIAQRLRSAILAGHFGPGERLGEEALARTMGVSRGPIREALVQLEREGLIVIRRNRGAFVAQLSRQDLDEVYTLRVAIERLAIERAVELADDSVIERMQDIVDTISDYLKRGITEQEAAELDIEFHDAIYAASNHRRLYDVWTNLKPQIHVLLLNRNVAHEDFRELVVSSHQQIVDAMRSRDRERAVEVLMDHLHGSFSRVVAQHEPAPAPGDSRDASPIGSTSP